MPEMNVQLLTQIRDWIAGGRPIIHDTPVVFFMDATFQQTPNGSGTGECKTVCCIAGAAVAYRAMEEHPGLPIKDAFLAYAEELGMRNHASYALMRWMDMEPTARRILGLDYQTACRLFNPASAMRDDFKLSNSWGGAFCNHKVVNEWAMAVIDHLLETGEVDWSVGRPNDV